MNAATVTETPNAFELAVQIQPHLGAEWRASLVGDGDGRPMRDCAELVGPKGATLYMRLGGYQNEGRVQVSGCWPKFEGGRIYSPAKEDRVTISCSAARDPKVLAREIARRLLTVYLPAYDKALQTVDRDDAAVARAKECAKGLAEKLGGTFLESYRGEFAVWPGDGLRVVKVRPDYDHGPQLSFEIDHCDEKTALAILETYKEGRP